MARGGDESGMGVQTAAFFMAFQKGAFSKFILDVESAIYNSLYDYAYLKLLYPCTEEHLLNMLNFLDSIMH